MFFMTFSGAMAEDKPEPMAFLTLWDSHVFLEKLWDANEISMEDAVFIWELPPTPSNPCRLVWNFVGELADAPGYELPQGSLIGHDYTLLEEFEAWIEDQERATPPPKAVKTASEK